MPLPGMPEVKDRILTALRKERHTLAAAMEKASAWAIVDTTLNLTFGTPFESTLVQKEGREIERIIKSGLGWDLKISTRVKEKRDNESSEQKDEQVELFKSVFRGTLVNRSKS